MLFPFSNVNANFLPILSFLFLKIFFYHFLARRCSGNKIPLFVWESLYFSHHFWRIIHKVQRFRLFFLWTLNFSLHCLLICIVSWEMLDVFPFLVWSSYHNTKDWNTLCVHFLYNCQRKHILDTSDFQSDRLFWICPSQFKSFEKWKCSQWTRFSRKETNIQYWKKTFVVVPWKHH